MTLSDQVQTSILIRQLHFYRRTLVRLTGCIDRHLNPVNWFLHQLLFALKSISFANICQIQYAQNELNFPMALHSTSYDIKHN